MPRGAARRLLIAEGRAGSVVRIEANGRRTLVMSDVKQPRWLAVSDTGRLFVSARRSTRFVRISRHLRGASGLLSLGFGLFLVYQIGFGGLFTGHPRSTPE